MAPNRFKTDKPKEEPKAVKIMRAAGKLLLVVGEFIFMVKRRK